LDAWVIAYQVPLAVYPDTYNGQSLRVPDRRAHESKLGRAIGRQGGEVLGDGHRGIIIFECLDDRRSLPF